MGEQKTPGRIMAGAFTAAGLGLVWLVVLMSLPSQEELSAEDMVTSPRTATIETSAPPPEPNLDLSIPGVPSLPPAAPSGDPLQGQLGATDETSLYAGQPHSRAGQVARLRCEAEIEQLCPDTLEGPGRMKCIKQRGQLLTQPCQHQAYEWFVKWKEERSRLLTACQVDTKRWCPSVTAGGGQILQCLQEHAQEVSDRCYETLPKGRVFFKQ